MKQVWPSVARKVATLHVERMIAAQGVIAHGRVPEPLVEAGLAELATVAAVRPGGLRVQPYKSALRVLAHHMLARVAHQRHREVGGGHLRQAVLQDTLDLADLSGRNLGVQTGTTGEAYAQENATGADIVSFDNPGDIFVALEAGEIEGVLQDIVVNADRLLSDDSVTLAETYPTDENYGFAVKEEGSEDLLTRVNSALETLRDNGTYDDIYNDWFGG